MNLDHSRFTVNSSMTEEKGVELDSMADSIVESLKG